MLENCGLFLSILSGSALVVLMIKCMLLVIKSFREGLEEIPRDSDSMIKLKSAIFYCFGFSITFWLLDIDPVLKSIASLIVGVVTTIVMSSLCPKVCGNLLSSLNFIRRIKRSLKNI